MKSKFRFAPVLFTFFVGFAILAAGCSRFAEGPNFSMRSATKRLANNWKVKDAAIYSTDITFLYAGGFFNFDEDGGYSAVDGKRFVSLPPFTQDTILPIAAVGSWRFLDGVDQLEVLYNFTFQDPYDTDVVYNEESLDHWEIRRLTEVELWIRNDSLNLKLEPFTE